MPAMAERMGAPHAMAGPWIARLLEEVQSHLDCQLCVAAPFTVKTRLGFVKDGVRYVVLPRSKRWHYWNYSWDGLREAAGVIDDFRPSLIHVHGSEHCLGLAHRHATWHAPTILSLQGILNAYAPRALGDLDLWEAFSSEHPLDLCRMSGALGVRHAWRTGAVVERDVLMAHTHFIGHTEWDRVQLDALRPTANYHRIGEPLRKEFYRVAWDATNRKAHCVFFGNLAGAHKGGHTILRALRLLARDFPDVGFRVAGRLGTARGYGRMFLNQAARLGVADRVTFLGFLDAAAMAAELAAAHVFVSASHIDNNPNSVGEAQAVGTPIVASYVGGVPEMLDDGRAGLLFPAGDAEMLTWRVAQLFRDDSLAESLSVAGRRQAAIRHDPATILDELVVAYRAAGCAVNRRQARDIPC
jgi:glycosyltransferase involved in cell wall biosynthesis